MAFWRPLLPGSLFNAGLIAVCFAPLFLHAGQGRGYVAGQTRLFWQDPLYPAQEEQNVSVSAWYEYFHDNDAGDQRLALSVFGRADNEDDERSHADIRELYWWKGFDNFEVYAGVRKIFWGVTESVHLVDVVNQDDLLENLDGEQKLGQPMLQLLTQRDWGLLEFFVLPGFREKSYPGESGRLRPALPIASSALYQSDQEKEHVDWAFRWSHYFSIWDMSLSHFSGTHRDPYFFPRGDNNQTVALQPYYAQIDQSGLALQATVDAWLLKLEAISLDERDYGRNSAAVLGFEYTFFTVAGSNSDLGLVAEYQWDDRTGIREPISQNDLAFGVRWAFNDIDGSEVLALINQDLEKDNRFFNVELSRRLSDNWKIEAEARIFSQPESNTFEYQLRNDDYLQLELRRYF